DVVRLAIALLLTPPPSAAIAFGDGGQAESPDGKADVLVATGTGGFTARIFLDQKSHRPLMLTYRAFDPRVFPGLGRASKSSGAAPGAAGALPIDAEKQAFDITLFLDDYRAENGIWLPHRLSRALDGEPDEELMVKSVRLNPAFGSSAFSDR